MPDPCPTPTQPGPAMPRIRHLWRVLAILLSTTHSWAAVQLVRGPDVSVSSNRVIIRWTTDVESGTRVQFGTAPARLDQRRTGPVGTSHEVFLTELHPGTTYHFTAGTARVPLATNSFTTDGGSNPSSPSTNPATTTGDTAGPTGPSSPQQQARPPPAKITWGSPRSLVDHFERHGSDFQARSADDYAAQAWQFLVRAKSDGLPAKLDSEGVIRIFDPRSGAFAAYNPDGTTKTYFKPGRRGYFDDQPGRTVDLRKLDDFQVPR